MLEKSYSEVILTAKTPHSWVQQPTSRLWEEQETKAGRNRTSLPQTPFTYLHSQKLGDT